MSVQLVITALMVAAAVAGAVWPGLAHPTRLSVYALTGLLLINVTAYTLWVMTTTVLIPLGAGFVEAFRKKEEQHP